MYIDENGKEYFNSKRNYHRLDSPTKEWSNGSKEWYKEGLLHRLDGPAIESSYGTKYWYILNEYLEEKEFNSWIIRIQKFL